MRSRRISSTSRKPRGGDQRDARALALQDRVGRDRRAVHDLRDVVDPERAAGERRLEPLGDTAAVVLGRREHLGALDRAVGCQEHEVGEGAADVDADARRHFAVYRLKPTSSAALSPRIRSFSAALRNAQCLRT